MILIPRFVLKRSKKEEELVNLLFKEFRKLGINVSISHTEVPSASYEYKTQGSGRGYWTISSDPRKAGRYHSYIRLVVLNKILLLNNCWPFVLHNPLHSDLVIAIDVKNNFAGITVAHKDGRTFAYTRSESSQREQLSRGHLAKKLSEYLSDELDAADGPLRTITAIRDGELYPSEEKGITDAMNVLKSDGLVAHDYDCNMIKIKKSSMLPVRMFETFTKQGSMKESTVNPYVGTFCIFGDTAFLCNTGRPYEHSGTTNPLQVVKVAGKTSFETILEDVFALANLTWTKPDDCSRYPITTRWTDIRLREEAGYYSTDYLNFGEEEEEEER
jgi:hypothetical protein